MQQEVGLRVRSAKDEMLATLVQFPVQVFQRMQGAAIHADHLMHLQYQNFRGGMDIGQDAVQFVGSAEKQSSIYTIEYHSFRNHEEYPASVGENCAVGVALGF